MIRRLAAPLLFVFAGLLTAAQEQSAGLWLDVPVVKQTEEGCGAAAISMVMHYWSAHGATVEASAADSSAIQQRLFSPKARGIAASDMERYFRDSGFRTFAVTGSWEDFREHLVEGRPLIVGLRPVENRAALHYVVVTGIDTQNAALFVNDPARGKLLRIGRAEFEKQWSAVHNWMLLAVPNAPAQASPGTSGQRSGTTSK